MKRIHQTSKDGTVDPAFKRLYRAGAVAALVAALLFRRNMAAEWMLLRSIGVFNTGPAVPPDTITGWFTLLQNQRLLGLTLLSLFDLLNYALVGLIFLALGAALRKAHPSGMLIAAALSLAGIVTYFASNQTFAMLALSRQYQQATSEAQRAMTLAAGQALLAIHQNAGFTGSGITLSFLLVSVAGLILALSMLQGGIFNKRTALIGILANSFGLGYYPVSALAAEFVFVPLSISAIFLLIWYLQVGGRLWVLGSQSSQMSLRNCALQLKQSPGEAWDWPD